MTKEESWDCVAKRGHRNVNKIMSRIREWVSANSHFCILRFPSWFAFFFFLHGDVFRPPNVSNVTDAY